MSPAAGRARVARAPALGVLGVVVGLSLVAVGCTTAPSSSDSPGTTAIGSGAPPAAGTGAPDAASAGPPLVFGPGDFDLPDVAVGLDGLGSYRATLTTTFRGTMDGAATDWSLSRTLAVAADGAGLTVTATGVAAPESASSEWEVGGAGLRLGEGGRCIASAASTGTGLRVRGEPARRLSGIAGGVVAGTTGNLESVTFDDRALALAGSVRATGTLAWDTGLGVVAAYDLVITAGADYFGAGLDGTLTHAYAVTEINGNVALDVPPECPAGRIGADDPRGAEIVLDVAGLRQLRSGETVAQVLEHYRSQAEGLGWTVTDAPTVGGDIGFITFGTPDGLVTVLAEARDGATTVFLMLDPGAGGTT